jgi:MFS family permease
VWKQALSASDPPRPKRLSPNVAALGFVSLLTAISSAMIYGLLPVFLVKVLGVNVASVGLIEGMAESANSLIKIVSGTASDRIGRRMPLVIFGYTLSAVVKTLFPLAGAASTVLAARVLDRLGKGIRDAPRDAFLTDMTAPGLRGTSFGLRLALAIAGFVFGPFFAVGLMRLSGDDFRLVFWIALIPAFLSIIVLILAVKEMPFNHQPGGRGLRFQRGDLNALPVAFWWAIVIASLLSLARFSPAFLVLKAHATGVDAAYVPMILGLMYFVYSVTAYPFGVLADRFDRRLQLGIGTLILVGADAVLAHAQTIWGAAFGAALWGLQMGVTQPVIGAIVADAAPERLRGAAFGIYDLTIGLAAFAASSGAGILWSISGPGTAFGVSASIASGVALMLLLQPLLLRSQK